MMKPLSEFPAAKIKVVFTDIDGTLTAAGRLPENSYQAMWQLQQAGIHVVPVTGRPAGWCEMIARLWPVHGVIGENGALYYSYQNKKMQRFYAQNASERKANRRKLNMIAKEVLKKIPEAGIASDQFTRLFDLAIDFCEDVEPLSKEQIRTIVSIFKKHGATAKISSIHVNGWFGEYDKVTTSRLYSQKEFGFSTKQTHQNCAFVGDSPNDEPMFAEFPFSFGVANIQEFAATLKHPPQFVASKPEADGFVEVVKTILLS